MIQLGSILELTKGKKPSSVSDKPKEGHLPYVDIEAFEKGIIKQYTNDSKCVRCNDGDLLIVCDGSRSGLVGRAVNGYVGSTLAVVKADGLINDYLLYFIQGKYRLLNTKKKGTGTPHLNAELLKQSNISVPSIPEQERIVARIEEMFSQLDAGAETLKKTKAQLAVYRQAVLKEAFDSVSGNEMLLIDSLCQNIVDCPHSTPKWSERGYICLRTTNFKRGKLDLSEKNYVTKETFDSRNARLVPLPGDVLYSREGAILGIACIIPEDTFVCLGQRMMLLRPGKALNNRYLMYYLNSPVVTNYVASITGGSASPHINVGDIKHFLIPCPDIKVQERITMEIDSRISVCDSIEQTVDAALQQAEAMRQSILKEAFEGRL